MTSNPPDYYGRTQTVLMVVHPFLLFAYWEVTPESCRQAHETMGPEIDGARAILRMYDISLIHFDGTNAHQIFDIEIGLEARGWYIPIWTADKSYCADVGFLARTGRFHPISRSNVIHTPRATPSSRTDEQWMRVRFVRRRKPEPTRALEYVNAPGSDRKLSAEALQHERSQQERDASMAEYLGGGLPTSRQG
ncbi:MAG: DUF4912 domain-containing protein [Nitrospirae bacterium]|nr:MAG: DUF4912 domain-containing protein [Nitrospirota bacterium]